MDRSNPSAIAALAERAVCPTCGLKATGPGLAFADGTICNAPTHSGHDPTYRPVSPGAAPPLGGRCIEINARTVTREVLIAQGVKPDAADELIAYANALLARHGLERYARHADDCGWRRNDPAGCDCGLARLETTIDARTTTPPSPYTIHA